MTRISPLSILLLCVCNDQPELVQARFFLRQNLKKPFSGGRYHNRRHLSVENAGCGLHGGAQEELEPTIDENIQQESNSRESVPAESSQQASKEESTTKPSKGLFGTRPRFKSLPRRQVVDSVKNRFQNRLEQIRSSANTLFGGPGKNGPGGSEHKERFLSALGPSVLAFWSNRGGSSDPNRILSFGTVYALSLLGSSVGFYSFLYFISVGYALGITLPLITALHVWQKQLSSSAVPPIVNGMSTFLHSALVILWGIRALTFFLWREYVNWPALHKQIRYVNESNAPALGVKCFIWIMYSFLYTAMLSPCWFRLQQSARIMSSSTMRKLTPTRSFSPLESLCAYLPIVLQLAGLILETVADYQKSTFKVDNRYEWCNVGLWKWSTHPNYLGEMIFWTGTYWGWILFTVILYFKSSVQNPSLLAWLGRLVFCSLGYIFIITVLRGSIASMGEKHYQKYGHMPEYAAFRQSHGLLGPKRHSYNQTIVEEGTADEATSTAPQ